jgi:hypothetical protein
MIFATLQRYLLIAGGVLVLGLALYAAWLYDQRKDDKAAALALQGRVDTLQADLSTLQRGQAADSAAIATLTASQAAATARATTVRQRVTTLKGNNDAMRVWLDTALPLNGCLLDDTCTADSERARAVPGAASSVR